MRGHPRKISKHTMNPFDQVGDNVEVTSMKNPIDPPDRMGGCVRGNISGGS